MAMQLKANIVSPHHSLIEDGVFVRQLHNLGFKVMTWTVNDPHRFKELIHMGVDGIITDYPEDLLKLRQGLVRENSL